MAELTGTEILDELRKCRAKIAAGTDASDRAKALIRQARDGKLASVSEIADAYEVSPGMIYQVVAPAMRDDG